MLKLQQRLPQVPLKHNAQILKHRKPLASASKLHGTVFVDEISHTPMYHDQRSLPAYTSLNSYLFCTYSFGLVGARPDGLLAIITFLQLLAIP